MNIIVEKLIDSEPELEQFCKIIACADAIGVDTEFVRERTYYPIPCLMQISDSCTERCLDLITLPRSSFLVSLMISEKILKIMHDGKQDLEIFSHYFQKLPTCIFDTQIAASLLGFELQVSYAELVKRLLNVDICKTLTRTKWDKRPLSIEEIEYAINDVRYLLPLHENLKKKLIQQNRLHWAEEEFQRLLANTYPKTNDQTLWQRVKGIGNLLPQQLVVLRGLASWREQIAINKNKPRQWILSDKTLLEIVANQPTTIGQLNEIEEVQKKRNPDTKHQLLNIIIQARHEPPAEWPQKTHLTPLTNAQQRQLKRLQQVVAKKANKLNVFPNVLATRNALEKLVRGSCVDSVLKGWRREILAEEIAST